MALAWQIGDVRRHAVFGGAYAMRCRSVPIPVSSSVPSRRVLFLATQHIVRFICAVGAILLGGCAVVPGVEITTLPGGVHRVTHPEKKFAVDAPPSEWRLKSPGSGVDVSWEKNVPGQFAMLLILSQRASPLPSEVLTQSFVEGAKGEPGKTATFQDVTVVNEVTVLIDGKETRRIEMDMRCACKGAVSFKLKSAVYLLRAKEFDYFIFLLTFPQHYDADRALVERQLRSFQPLD